MGIFFNLNGIIYKERDPVLTVDNRSFRYGDGLFETMKYVNGKILLRDFHFQRLFAGMFLLNIETPGYLTAEYLEEEITALCKMNSHLRTTRVRLTIFRGKDDQPDSNLPGFIIQTWVMSDDIRLNTDGLEIDIYPIARKSCDRFSNIKSNNFLPYVMASLYANENKLHDCLLLNTHERICESTIANIFIIKDKVIFTPPLSEGCVAGVIRKWILQNSKIFPFEITEKSLTPEEISEADEIFLTNAVRHIRWVKQLGTTQYQNEDIKLFHGIFIKSIY